MAAYGQLAPRAQDGCSTADPGSFADSDRPALRDALLDNGDFDLLVSMIVVLNHDLLTDEYIAFYVNAVLARDDAVVTYVTTIINHDGGVTNRIVSCNVEPHMITYAYRITQANPPRTLPADLTREMNG